MAKRQRYEGPIKQAQHETAWPEGAQELRPQWHEDQIRLYLSQLPCWAGSLDNGSLTIERLVGGLCNRNYRIRHADGEQAARIGKDIPVHGIIQSSVQASMYAAGEIGISPKVILSEPHLTIVDFLPGGCLKPEDFIEDEERISAIVALLQRLHAGSRQVREALTYFWPFQVIRNYVAIGTERQSRLCDEFPEVLRINALLESAIDRFVPVFTHNDTVPQNFVFDGDCKIWMIDWDYGGYGHPMFDLVGVSCNSDMAEKYERIMFEKYYGTLTETLRRQLIAFKLALNLREYMWGMTQEVTSDLGDESVAESMAEIYPDQEAGYEGYTNMNKDRFEANWDLYRGAFD